MEYIISTQFDGKKRKLYRTICGECLKDFYGPKHRNMKFCSPTCRQAGSRNRHTFNCAQCGVSFDRRVSAERNSKSGIRFCSKSCKDKAQCIEGIKAIQPKHYKDGGRYYRERAIRAYEAKCNKCGYDEFEKMLDVDHIDGNRKHNALTNLQVLCVWCHALKTRGIESKFAPLG